MNNKEAFEFYVKDIIWDCNDPNKHSGGQSCGNFYHGVKLIHKDLQFEININVSRSSIKNRQLALLMFELFIMECINRKY
jgi:hypothetical protein